MFKQELHGFPSTMVVELDGEKLLMVKRSANYFFLSSQIYLL